MRTFLFKIKSIHYHNPDVNITISNKESYTEDSFSSKIFLKPLEDEYVLVKFSETTDVFINVNLKDFRNAINYVELILNETYII